MIKILQKCELLNNILIALKSQKTIDNYRIYLRTNEILYVYIVSSIEEEIIEFIRQKIYTVYPQCEVEFISNKEVIEDSFYNQVFKKSRPIVFENGRRRYQSLYCRRNCKHTIPVVSFYSYKGGMGRTTTMVAYAMHLSMNLGKKVVIIDCDIEAPGITNFFLRNPAEENQRNGLIEYLLDKECGLSKASDINDYLWLADSTFSGNGSIYIMPAGNLSSDYIENSSFQTHQSNYIEGISRIDISNADYATEIMNSLIDDIKASINPDIVLIDSKTGLCDIMGITTCCLSDYSVGFFRSDIQSKPGLEFFVNTMIKNKKVETVLVNSILPSSRSGANELHKAFKNQVHDIEERQNSNIDVDFPIFPISRNADFEVLGSTSEEISDFVSVIQEQNYPDYKNLFDGLTNIIFKKKDKAEELIGKYKSDILTIAAERLSKVDLYAENIDIEQDIDDNVFFFRSCMIDLFNIDKSIILGSKGTGKSYIYKTLSSKKGLEVLQKKSGKEETFKFVNAIDRQKKIFRVSKIGNNLSSLEKYRFWLIYTWTVLYNELQTIYPDFQVSDGLSVGKVEDDLEYKNVIEDSIKSEVFCLKVENEFKRLDDYLKDKDTKEYVTIIYDQLDEVVEPENWSKWIPELINYWRNRRYSRISGKIFLRSDLFKSLVGLTNIKDIENQAIDIEWKKEEIFSYFFRLILNNDSKNKILEIMQLYNNDSPELLNMCKQSLQSYDKYVLDTNVLKMLVITFFGYYVDPENTSRMGFSYDWFYKNLKNADDTISLRPFIDLMKEAIKIWKEEKYKSQETISPILYQRYYIDKNVRKNAASNYCEDLVRGANGNEPISYLFAFYDEETSPRYKKISLRQLLFEEMLSKVIKKYKDKESMADMTIDSLATILITNGIVKRENYGRGNIYVFSFLYKYRLGLRGS